MGCDIHFYVEVREGPDEPWRSADTWREDHAGSFDVPAEMEFYNIRDYRLFGILAGVRYEQLACIAAPRGLPSDVSAPVALAAARWEADAHNHSHLTLAELIAFDWTQEDDGERYYTFARELLSEAFPRMAALGDPENVRCVFWFDN